MFRKHSEYEVVTGNSWNPFNRAYSLLCDYTFEFMGSTYTIPEGYVWNGPTGVPILKRITDGWLEPSLVHDWLYEHHFELNKPEPFFTQEDVDDRFRYDLRHGGASWLATFLIDVFYKKVFKEVWDSQGTKKMDKTSFILYTVLAVSATVAFMAIYWKFSGVIISAILGLIS